MLDSDALAHVVERRLRAGLQTEEELAHPHVEEARARGGGETRLETGVTDEPGANVGVRLHGDG